jgi:hypothetical protein
MCRSEVTEAADKNSVMPPAYYVVLTYAPYLSARWVAEFFTSDEKDEAREYFEKETRNEHNIEVRLMGANMLAKWGPEDPGGLFNSMPRKKRE